MATMSRNRSPNPAGKTIIPQPSQQATCHDGESDEFEFGGSFGTAALMAGFPIVMYYMWIGATYYDGQFPMPEEDQTWKDFAHHLLHLVHQGAYPTAKAWSIYWSFFILEAIMYVFLSMFNQLPIGTTLTTAQGIATCLASPVKADLYVTKVERGSPTIALPIRAGTRLWQLLVSCTSLACFPYIPLSMNSGLS
jgi:hypothetical protein